MNLFPGLRQILAAFHLNFDPETFVTVFSLLMARMGGALPFIRFLGGQFVPGNVQIALTMLIALLLYPSFSTQVTAATLPGYGKFGILILKEILVGTIMGMLVQILFSAVEAAGSLIESVAGLKMVEILAPQLPSEIGTIGQLLGHSAVVLYLAAGFHLVFIRQVVESYQIIPLLSMPSFGPGFLPLAEFAGRATAGFVTVAFQIAAPILFLLILINTGANLVFRASLPQMQSNPFQSVTAVAALGSLFLAAGLISAEILREGQSYLLQVQDFIVRMK